MTNLLLDAPGMLGAQRPRIWTAPEHALSDIELVDELCGAAGLVLDDWQRFVLEHSLGMRPDGKWAAFQVGVCAPRQNGKNSILEALELAGLFLFGDRLIIHSAHQWDTSLEAFSRLLSLIEDTPDLKKRVKRVSGTHGQEGITLTNGQRIRFRTRSKSGGGGRGFTCDRLIFDEAMEFAESTHGSILPTLSARPNPQVWYTGSAVDQDVQPEGIVFARLRERGHRGDAGVAWFEWSADFENPELVTDEIAADPEVQALANPALGMRITAEYVENERQALGRRSFAVERLGVGDWPRTDGLGDAPIPVEDWDACEDPTSTPVDPVWLAFDVTPSRHRASIAVAGFRADGQMHAELIRQFRGTSEIVGYLVARAERHGFADVLCDGASPAASLIPELEAAGLEVTTVSAIEHGQACGVLADVVDRRTLCHRGGSELREAFRGAVRRPLGDGAWALSRKNSSTDISPAVAVALAVWGASSQDRPLPPELMFPGY